MTRLPPGGEPIAVWDGKAAPEGFDWRGVQHRILEISNRWRVDTRWWEPGQRVARDYLKVITDTGHLCLIYRDARSGGWFLARLYD
jgi:hypothetical protein